MISLQAQLLWAHPRQLLLLHTQPGQRPPPDLGPLPHLFPEDVFMHEESDFEAQDMVSDDEDIGSRHIPRVNLNQDWFKPLSKDERLATPETCLVHSLIKSTCPYPQLGICVSLQLHGGMSQASDQSSRRQTSQVSLLADHSLGGLQVQVLRIQSSSSSTEFVLSMIWQQGDRLALSITKMKAVYYPDVGLVEQMVPDQM
ncbi:hypothetical protein Tco_0738181 [Tanacetum coccineum]